MSQVTVKVEGLDKLVAKLGHITDPVGHLLQQAGEFARDRVKQYAKPHPVDKGTLAAGTRFELAGKGASLHARVFPAQNIYGIAQTVEEGRGPGKPPTVRRIERWGVLHGFIAEGEGWGLAQRIAMSGTKGVRMFARAAEDTDKRLPALVEEMTNRMEKDWGK